MSYAEFAQDLRRLADELESGRYKHVDGSMDIALHDSGDRLTVTADLELQRAVPADHALWAPPGLRAVKWTDAALPGDRCFRCVLHCTSQCIDTPCLSDSRHPDLAHPSGKTVYFVKA